MVLTVRLGIEEIRQIAVESLINRFGERLEGIVLFGSRARKKVTEWSDIDLFVVIEDLPKDPVERGRVVYRVVAPPLLQKFNCDITVIEAEAKEIGKGKELTPLLINIAHDGIILYDKRRQIADLFARIREAVRKAGLIKYKTADGKYGWKPRRKLGPGEVFEVRLEG